MVVTNSTSTCAMQNNISNNSNTSVHIISLNIRKGLISPNKLEQVKQIAFKESPKFIFIQEAGIPKNKLHDWREDLTISGYALHCSGITYNDKISIVAYTRNEFDLQLLAPFQNIVPTISFR